MGREGVNMRRLIGAHRESGYLLKTVKENLPYLWIEVVLPGGSLLFAHLFLRKSFKRSL